MDNMLLMDDFVSRHGVALLADLPSDTVEK